MKKAKVEPFFAEINEEHLYTGKVLYREGSKANTINYEYDAVTGVLQLSQYGVVNAALSAEASSVIHSYVIDCINKHRDDEEEE